MKRRESVKRAIINEVHPRTMKYYYFVRYRKDDQDKWSNTRTMSEKEAKDTAEFLTRYGYTARTCVLDGGCRTHLSECGYTKTA